MESSKKSPDKNAKRKRSKNKCEEILNIQDVHKVVLSEDLQTALDCEVGVKVSVENCFTYIKKCNLFNYSIFKPFKTDLEDYQSDDVLMVYLHADDSNFDEFLICITDESRKIVDGILKKMELQQYEKLRKIVVKTPKPWITQGSDIVMHKNRSLLHILLETKYPIRPTRAQFRICNTNEKNYIEILCQEKIDNIQRRRIDNCVQAAPSHKKAEAQTICTFPKNKQCQYKYEFQTLDFKNFEKQVNVYFEKYRNEFTDMLLINGNINLYTEDYQDLQNKKIISRGKLNLTEFSTFTDYNLCREKMVETATWHPEMNWIFVVAYSGYSSHFFITQEPTEDEIFAAVHNLYPVLVWNMQNCLQPILILQSPREIMHLSFCPYDGNVIIGGCRNGQVIIWDLKGKIEYTERNKKLTPQQFKYKKNLYEIIGWQNYLQPIDVVKPTIISSMDCSHGNSIVGIRWRSPHHDFTKTGQLVRTEDHKVSMQFETCSLDGNIFVWDLCPKLNFQETATLNRLKTIKRKPSTLKIIESQYKHLHLKPIYNVKVIRDKKPLAITHASIKKYARLRVEDFEEIEDIEADMHIGTMGGEYAHIKWIGQTPDFDEEIQPEQNQFLNYGCYHDGPVFVTSINKNGTILTVGGSVFALWRDDYQDGPIVWRKLDHLITEGRWHEHNQSRFNIIKNNGDVEHWMLHFDSYKSFDRQTLNNGSIFVWKERQGKFEDHLVGIGDQFGNFRLHHLDTLKLNAAEEERDFSDFINREIAARQIFQKWQSWWCEKYVPKVEVQKFADFKEFRQIGSEVDKKVGKIQALDQFQRSRLRWELEDKRRIRSIIKEKKQVDVKVLEWRKEPFEVMLKEKLELKEKLKQKHNDTKGNWNEAVETVFLGYFKEKIKPVEDPYSPDFSPDGKQKCMEEYRELCADIQVKPYEYVHDIKDVMLKGREKKRLTIDADKPIHPHLNRLILYKQKKLEEQKRLEEELKQKQLEELKQQEKKKSRVRLRTSAKLKSVQEIKLF